MSVRRSAYIIDHDLSVIVVIRFFYGKKIQKRLRVVYNDSMAPRAKCFKNKSIDKTIAIIEDEAVLSRVLDVKLKNAGFRTILAVDGEEASRIIQENRPDLVLLDLVMPKKDGFSVLREMRESKDTHDTPVMILSNHGSDEDRSRSKELGVSNYLIKSTTRLDSVVDQVENVLGRPPASKKLTKALP